MERHLNKKAIRSSHKQGMSTAGCFSEHEFIYMIWLWYDNAEQNDYTVTQTELSSEGAQ